MHLLLKRALIEILQQDGYKEVQYDLLADQHEEDPEDGGAYRGHRAIVVVEDCGLPIIGQDNEDEREGVQEGVEVEGWRDSMLEVYIERIWVQLSLVGEELQTQKGEDEGEQEEQEREASHILQGVAHGIQKELESLPLPAELEDSHDPDSPESCYCTSFVNNIIIAVRVQNLCRHYVDCASQHNQGIEEVVQLALIVGLNTRCSQPDGQLRHEEQCKNYVEFFYDKIGLLINGVPIQREDNRVGNNCECHKLGEGWT